MPRASSAIGDGNLLDATSAKESTVSRDQQYHLGRCGLAHRPGPGARPLCAAMGSAQHLACGEWKAVSLVVHAPLLWQANLANCVTLKYPSAEQLIGGE